MHEAKLILTTSEGNALLNDIANRCACGAEELPVEARSFTMQAITTASIRMLCQAPDARQRIIDELRVIVDAGEGAGL